MDLRSSCFWAILSTAVTSGLGCTSADPVADPGAGGTEDPVTRGEYIVNVIGGCADCHDPKTGPKYFLSGVECLEDENFADPTYGCLHSANLTNHETGLKNRTDTEIKNMFMTGVRPTGSILHPLMPYIVYGNMSEEDADAVVAYLRTVEGVDHEVPAQQEPWKSSIPDEANPVVDKTAIPMPSPAYPNQEAALRGRYLASSVGQCMYCHTPWTLGFSGLEMSRAFQGGLGFVGSMGMVDSANLTPHPTTGLGEWTVEDIVRALKEGTDKDGMGVCGPMPAGPDGYLADLRQQDTEDIAHFLLSLEPQDNAVANSCQIPK